MALTSRKEYYEANRGALLARVKEYQEANPEMVRASKKKYYAANLGKCAAWNAKHRIAKLRGKPIRAGHQAALTALYESCPNGHHVDHVIPLQGTLVEGIHTPWNLQYLTASENGSKYNKFNPDDHRWVKGLEPTTEGQHYLAQVATKVNEV